MNTITKEWLQNTITGIESIIDDKSFVCSEIAFEIGQVNNILTAFKIALASLAAVSDERAAYELFMEKRFGESVDRRRAKNGDREYMAWDMALGWIIWCHRAAMLQGGQPVNQTYNLPQTHFEQVADLYEMQFEDGRTCTFHTDAQKAVQWLQACDGNRVQEYVKLERLQNALAGNYPVTPDGWISCSDRMPEKGQNVLISVNFDSSLVEQLICSARYTGSTFRRGDATIKPGNGIEQATHWMPLPEPPQEVK
ncbi:TPA: DUF551 domain-containing protein [Escherichia coli]|uniref:DUF551 domain-containing protein n=1 Tax=Escherichia coli TaxID=562 RepID=A0A785EQQ7_ECOLX|nr:DUF551 domain-containing protein [Escherichia coli]ELA3934901.1 DUF551 domain-containing protein [Escherichia coli]HAH7770044.1 DUF551 domain-containing protein [Escherichia coli]